MARKYKRDSKGRFAGSSQGRTGALKSALARGMKRDLGSRRTTTALVGGGIIAAGAGQSRTADALFKAASANITVGRIRRAGGSRSLRDNRR